MTKEQTIGLLRICENGGSLSDIIDCIGPEIYINNPDDITRFFTAYLIATDLIAYKPIAGVEIVVSETVKDRWPAEGSLIAHLTSEDSVRRSWNKR